MQGVLVKYIICYIDENNATLTETEAGFMQ